MLQVVIAVMSRSTGDVLLQLRNTKREFPLTWECPGGKVEGRESHHEALRRELEEELGILPGEVTIHQKLYATIFQPPVTQVLCELSFYDVQLPPHRPPRFVLKDALAVGWFSRAALEFVTLTPGNRALFQRMGWLAE